jgi:hypothetical protein
MLSWLGDAQIRTTQLGAANSTLTKIKTKIVRRCVMQSREVT